MVKTTIYLDSQTALALRQMAGAQGRKQAELIREALQLFTNREQREMPAGVGKFGSGRSDVSEAADKLYRTALRNKK